MRWLLRIVFILIAVVVLTVGALLLMPGDKLGEILVDKIQAQTGRELVLGGDVRLTFWPVLGVETGPVTLGNAEWAGDAPMLSASGLAVGVDAASLLSGQVKIRQIVAKDPVLRLEIADGRGNWDFGPVPSRPASGTSGASGTSVARQAVTLDRLQLINARLIYVEDGTTRFDFDKVNLTARWPSTKAPLAVQAERDGVEANLALSDLPAFAAGAATALDSVLTAPGGRTTFAGTANIAGELSGRIRVTTPDSAGFLAALGQPGMSLPEGLGQVADISAQATYTRDGRLALRDLKADLDQNSLAGKADIVLGNPPHVTARVRTGRLDLSRTGSAGQPGRGGASEGSSTDGWSKTPIDASPLALADGDIRLDAESISLPGLEVGQSRVTLSLERSRAVLKMNPVTLFSGKLTGRLIVNNRNGLSVRGKFLGQDIDVQQALSTLGGVERLSGLASAELEFLGVGETEDQIMRSLSGQGRVEMGRGVISGIDLDSLMGSGKGAGGTTVFNSLTASYRMDKGNLFNTDLLMQLDNFRADGEGRVGLGARDLDYLFTPVALRANAGAGLAVPVRIVGPWADPKIRPDLSQVIKAAAGKNLEEVEAQAKEQLRQKLSEELDTTVTEDQDVEDLIKDRLKGEAQKGLLKLLGVD